MIHYDNIVFGSCLSAVSYALTNKYPIVLVGEPFMNPLTMHNEACSNEEIVERIVFLLSMQGLVLHRASNVSFEDDNVVEVRIEYKKRTYKYSKARVFALRGIYGLEPETRNRGKVAVFDTFDVIKKSKRDAQLPKANKLLLPRKKKSNFYYFKQKGEMEHIKTKVLESAFVCDREDLIEGIEYSKRLLFLDVKRFIKRSMIHRTRRIYPMERLLNGRQGSVFFYSRKDEHYFDKLMATEFSISGLQDEEVRKWKNSVEVKRKQFDERDIW